MLVTFFCLCLLPCHTFCFDPEPKQVTSHFPAVEGCFPSREASQLHCTHGLMMVWVGCAGRRYSLQWELKVFYSIWSFMGQFLE